MRKCLRERAKRLFYLLVAIILVLVAIPYQVFAAKKKEQPHNYYNNDIRWYSKDESCGPAGTSYGGGDSDGSDVYLIGDSISVHSQNEIKEALPNITFTMNDSIRSGSYFAKDSAEYGPSGISRLDKVGSQPIIVFALGTNGGVSEDNITALINKLNGKDVKVILMTIYYSGGWSSGQMTSTNKVIKDAASKYDNITYMDWAAAAGKDGDKYIMSSDHTHPTNPDGRKLFAETMKNAVNEITEMGENISTGGTGNFEKILTAKNANEYVFDVPSYSQWSAQWGDGDTANMKKLLENYGDLAYQLGDAVGAPYIAILVQMRYEDPNSVCGANNFWGNGCDPAHAYRGGATIQGKDLGEGFVQYGKTLTNGYHDQALGEQDPKRYLELIGPTWVQGDPNGPGYGSIDGMRHSVDALTAYIESPEGQEIVKQFGNYHGTYKGGKQCKGSALSGDGVTTVDINGKSYAFPIAYATKENFLENNSTHPSVLSSKRNGWYHHDYPAVDLGIYMKMVTGKEFTTASYPEWPTSSTLGDSSGTVSDVKHMNSSAGAELVALTDGVITYYQHYTNGVNGADQQICAITSLQSSTDGNRYIYIHLGWDDEYAAKVGQQVKVGDRIGRIGKMPCAQYTQSHVHLQDDVKSERIKSIIDQLYDALPANAEELAAREGAGGGENDTPVGDLYSSSENVQCDSRTSDVGIKTGYHNGSSFKIRVCALDKNGYAIKSSGSESHGGYGSGYSGGYALVNSRVSGAYAALAAKYYKDHNNTTMGSSSSWRTNQHQQDLYNTYGSVRAARPGYSNHQAGLAIDFNTGCDLGVSPSACKTAESIWLGNNIGAFGLKRPVSNESWHVQP